MRPDYYKVDVWANVPGHAEKVKVTIECFDLIDALGGGFYFGNALKYLFRAGRKTADRSDDLSKAVTYCRQVKIRDELRKKDGSR